jgi:hypothetical protein
MTWFLLTSSLVVRNDMSSVPTKYRFEADFRPLKYRIFRTKMQACPYDIEGVSSMSYRPSSVRAAIK